MENRKRVRRRKREQRQRAGRAMLIVALLAAIFVLGNEVFSLGNPDGGVFSRVSGYVHVLKQGAAAKGKDGFAEKGKDGAAAKGKDGAAVKGKGGAAEKGKGGAAAKGEDTLILVNRNNALPDGFVADLAEFDGAQVARALLDGLEEMREAAEKDGVGIFVGSAYRSETEQGQVFGETVAKYMAEGFSESEAEKRAGYTVAPPGHSEHETGLAIDFSLAGDAERQAVMWDWLSDNAHEYGFILRYPEGKGNITGCSFEPWHFRYVGKDHAKAMYGQGLTLEEYLGADPVRSPQPGAPGKEAPGALAG